ncbi:CotH kinase family protein [Leadbettera azotonutricia]|uniref:CotH protein n=1 Tax=Leadbettera azotonutricia (strain ATCC BAA-888 / DSM 13862 / ZAS-9) TaxID=545695 RepID=F5Y762_LEAAZ|nr:CotH kinase family protein [Leadbettera azotonutricia]AEF82863.1 CotH protein [Leadbettera azotonutricia ZAS-9]
MQNSNLKQAIILAITLILAGCSIPLDHPAAPVPSDGKARVTINLFRDNARTLLPQTPFSGYSLSLTNGDKEPVSHDNINTDSISMDLELGTWKINAAGYVEIGGIVYEAAAGEKEVEVMSSDDLTIDIDLYIPPAGGKGKFYYNIGLPQDVTLSTASLTLKALSEGGSDYSFNLLKDSGRSPRTIDDLSSGYYLMTITAGNGILSTGKTDVVHIYPGMLTEAKGADFSFTSADFSAAVLLQGEASVDSGYTVKSVHVYRDMACLSEIGASDGIANGMWLLTIPSNLYRSIVYLRVELENSGEIFWSKPYIQTISLTGSGNIILTVPVFTVNASLEGPASYGTITASPTGAAEGTLITITVTPTNEKYRFKDGSLKAVYGSTEITPTQDTANAGKYTFAMPANNATIKGRFEAKADLSGITVTKTGTPAVSALEPVFKADIVNYEVYVPNGVTNATITGTASATVAKITGNVKYTDIAAVTYWRNGTQVTTGNFALSVGPNIITIRVSAIDAADGAVKNYTLTINREYPDPQISAFRFTAADNDLTADIIGTFNQSAGTIKLEVPYAPDGNPDRPKTTKYIDNITQLKAAFITNDTANIVTVNGVTQASGLTGNDFRRDVQYTVSTPDGRKSKSYTVTLVSPQSTGLPVIKIDTQNYQEITDKEIYVKTNISVFDPNNTSYSFVHTGYGDEIRGRGNVTWTQPKKPYRIKFGEKQSLFGLTAAKSWVLLAGYYGGVFTDVVGFELEKRFNLPFYNHYTIVEVFLNGNYNGHYLLTEQVQVAKGRININDQEDFLVQIDAYYDEDPRFRTSKYSLPVMIKSPELGTNANAAEYNFVRNPINELTNKMAQSTFPENGYRDLIDMDSFVNWLMIQEIVNNSECRGPNNAYMYKVQGGKISMAQPWDFNWAYGARVDDSEDDTGFYSIVDRCLKHSFLNRFFDDPVFCARYKERWNEMYPSIRTIDAFVDVMAALVAKSDIENARCWHKADYWFANTEFAEMKAWLKKEIAYLHTEINKY